MRSLFTIKIAKASAMITANMTTLRDSVNVVGTTTLVRPVVVVLLMLGSFLAVWIGSPFTAERVAAASIKAMPAPTPPDQEEIDALVERLKGTLAESIDDEDTVNSIVEKWDMRALARRTKKQIIDALFADVKVVVRDKETQDAVWESWSEMIAEADAEEPKRPVPRAKSKPTPEVAVNDEEEPAAPPARSNAAPTAAETTALINTLIDALSSCLDDADMVAEIKDSWEKQGLGGMTKKQIMDTLLRDVKAIVPDKEARDQIWDCFIGALQDKKWDSWSIYISQMMDQGSTSTAPTKRGGDQPAPKPGRVPASSTPTESDATPKAAKQESGFVNGRYVLSDESRRNKGNGNMQVFSYERARVKVWKPEKRQYRGYQYTVYYATEPVDSQAQAKAAGADKAVKAVMDAGFKLPDDLRFYCTSIGESGIENSTKTEAFERGPNWTPIAYIMLGPGGSPDALSTTANGFNGYDTRTIRAIHEIGHIIHERQAGDYFWKSPSFSAKGDPASKVSQYATTGSFKEFVAETFAGLIIGKKWPSDVLAEYHRHLGPVLSPF